MTTTFNFDTNEPQSHPRVLPRAPRFDVLVPVPLSGTAPAGGQLGPVVHADEGR